MGKEGGGGCCSHSLYLDERSDEAVEEQSNSRLILEQIEIPSLAREENEK
jgi:hypothetical protein